MGNNIKGQYVPRIKKGDPIRASWLNRLAATVNSAIRSRRLSGCRKIHSNAKGETSSELPFTVSVSVKSEKQSDGHFLHQGIIAPQNGGYVYFCWGGSDVPVGFGREERFYAHVGEPFVIADLSSEMKKTNAETLTYWVCVRVNAKAEWVQNDEATAFFTILMGFVPRDQYGATRNYSVEVLDEETHQFLSSAMPVAGADGSGVFETCFDCARVVFTRNYSPDGTEYYTATIEQYLRSDFFASILCIPGDFNAEVTDGQ